MSATPLDKNSEPRWKTYLKAIIFVLPAVTAWGFACVYLVPKIKEISLRAQLDSSEIRWLWHVPMFLVEYGRLLCVASAAVLVLLELFVRVWARHRLLAVSTFVWVVNVAVLLGLTLLLIVVLIAAPSLAHAK